MYAIRYLNNMEKKKESKPLMSEEDLIKLKKVLKSWEFDKVIERFNEDARQRALNDDSKKYKDPSWWAKFKDLPLGK